MRMLPGSPSLGFLLALALLPGSILRAQGSTQTAPIDSTWLSYDAATKTVHFQLIAGLTGLNGALNYNGFGDGGLVLEVPAGSKVVVDFTNNDGMLPHSAEVIAASFRCRQRLSSPPSNGRTPTSSTKASRPWPRTE